VVFHVTTSCERVVIGPLLSTIEAFREGGSEATNCSATDVDRVPRRVVSLARSRLENRVEGNVPAPADSNSPRRKVDVSQEVRLT
jgi:hypothetical protein